jgi:hypothetical protein
MVCLMKIHLSDQVCTQEKRYTNIATLCYYCPDVIAQYPQSEPEPLSLPYHDICFVVVEEIIHCPTLD